MEILSECYHLFQWEVSFSLSDDFIHLLEYVFLYWYQSHDFDNAYFLLKVITCAKWN